MRFHCLALAAALSLSALYACATGGTEAPDETTPPLAPPPAVRDAGVRDSRPTPIADAAPVTSDAASDAVVDGSVDAGPTSPASGTACAVPSEIYKKPCGACGTSEAVCESVDGGPLSVSVYGACYGQLAGGCVPGTTTSAACGLCGSVTSVCKNNCIFATGSCVGEPANACAPGTRMFTSAGCPIANTYRVRTCGATCTFGVLAPSCEEPVNDKRLALGSAVGDITTAEYALDAVHVAKTMTTGACGTAVLTSTSNYPYFDVEVVNPNAQPAVVDLYNSTTTGTPTYLDTTLRVYTSTLPPQDDASLKACSAGIGDTCPASMPCGGYYLAALPGVTIPANGKVLVRVSTKYGSTSTAFSLGPVKLNARLTGLL